MNNINKANILKEFLKTLNELYLISVSILLYLFFKPVIILFKFCMKKNKYEKAIFTLIKISNCFFPHSAYKLGKIRKLEYDLREYRDKYDTKGLDLYFSYFSPDQIIKNKRILDVGCGTGGKDLLLLKYEPLKVVGIDLSERNINCARELINKSNKNKLFFYKMDLLKTSGSRRFDTVVSFTVFEHIERRLLLPILNKIYTLLDNHGKAIIVFNHYYDKYGMHLGDYIYHPWPQTVFDEDLLFKYWNYKFKNDNKMTENSFYPKKYKHGIEQNNSDCLMNLNKVSINEFEKMIESTRFIYLHKHLYSKSPLLKFFPFISSKYLLGSATYILEKNE